MYKYLVEFRVVGAREFPTDMLRYDQCFPRNTDDAISIGRTFDYRNPITSPIEICLVKHCRTKDQSNVTSGRWASFGWHVKGEPKVTKL